MSRLSDEFELGARLAKLEGDYEWRYGKVTRALELYEKVFIARISATSSVSQEYCEGVTDFVRALSATCMSAQALRVTESALALIAGKTDLDRWAAHLNVLAADMQVDVGDLRGGLRRVSEFFPQTHAEERPFALVAYSNAQLLAGTWSLMRSPKPAPTSREISFPCVRMARLHDNVELLREACATYIGDSPLLVTESHAVGTTTLFLLRAFESGDAGLVDDFRDFNRSMGRRWSGIPKTTISACIYEINMATLCRYVGRQTTALEHTLACASLIAKFDTGVMLPIVYRAYHYTNVLKLSRVRRKQQIPRKLVKQAREFFTDHIRKGYTVFRDIDGIEEYLTD